MRCNSFYALVTATAVAACSSHPERTARSAQAGSTNTGEAASNALPPLTPALPLDAAPSRDSAPAPSRDAVVVVKPPTDADAAPVVAATAKPSDFVDISLIIPDAVIAMRYAGADNFVGQTIYRVNRCMLRRAVATQLAAAALALRSEQRRLWLWDCYRPASIQKEFWKLLPDSRYVAKPTFAADGTPLSGSRHSRGAAVDIGLANQAGELLPMPSAHDEFSRKAHRSVAKRSAAAADYALLDAAMTKAGFTGIATEWWHYDSNKADAFPLADTALIAP